MNVPTVPTLLKPSLYSLGLHNSQPQFGPDNCVSRFSRGCPVPSGRGSDIEMLFLSMCEPRHMNGGEIVFSAAPLSQLQPL